MRHNAKRYLLIKLFSGEGLEHGTLQALAKMRETSQISSAQPIFGCDASKPQSRTDRNGGSHKNHIVSFSDSSFMP